MFIKVFLIFFCLSSFLLASNSSENFELSIENQSSKLKRSMPIHIELRLLNKGDEAVYVYESSCGGLEELKISPSSCFKREIENCFKNIFKYVEVPPKSSKNFKMILSTNDSCASNVQLAISLKLHTSSVSPIARLVPKNNSADKKDMTIMITSSLLPLSFL